MTLIFEFSRSYEILTIWWPRSGVTIYQIVTGVTSDVGVPSTHLVYNVIYQSLCAFCAVLTTQCFHCFHHVSPSCNLYFIRTRRLKFSDCLLLDITACTMIKYYLNILTLWWQKMLFYRKLLVIHVYLILIAVSITMTSKWASQISSLAMVY